MKKFPYFMLVTLLIPGCLISNGPGGTPWAKKAETKVVNTQTTVTVQPLAQK